MRVMLHAGDKEQAKAESSRTNPGIVRLFVDFFPQVFPSSYDYSACDE